MRNVVCHLGHLSLRKYSSLYSYTSLHSSDQEESFPTAKEIGKDLSVIFKTRDIPEINNFFGKFSL